MQAELQLQVPQELLSTFRIVGPNAFVEEVAPMASLSFPRSLWTRTSAINAIAERPCPFSLQELLQWLTCLMGRTDLLSLATVAFFGSPLGLVCKEL